MLKEESYCVRYPIIQAMLHAHEFVNKPRDLIPIMRLAGNQFSDSQINKLLTTFVFLHRIL